jgi:hypothetical protein
MIRLDLSRAKDDNRLFPELRRLVTEGAADQPVQVWYDGRHSLDIASLHRAALLSVSEDPSPRFVPWSPHPRSEVPHAIQALLDAREASRDATRKGRARMLGSKQSAGSNGLDGA